MRLVFIICIILLTGFIAVNLLATPETFDLLTWIA